MERERGRGFITVMMNCPQSRAMNDLDDTDAPRRQIAKRLQEAIKDLRADVARVELWASALTSFTQPIPDYDPSEETDLRREHVLAASKPDDKA